MGALALIGITCMSVSSSHGKVSPVTGADPADLSLAAPESKSSIGPGTTRRSRFRRATTTLERNSLAVVLDVLERKVAS